MDDVAAAIATARTSLALLDEAFTRCWCYDLGMIGDRITHEAGPVSTSHTESPALWTNEKGTLHDAYRRATQQLARGHLAMADAGATVHWVTEIHLHPTGRTRTVPLPVARIAATMLAALLGNGQTANQRGDLAPTETHSLLQACDYANAALRELPEAIVHPGSWAPEAIVEPCLHCNDKPPEVGRKWCAGCRRAHQPDRMSCRVCGLGREMAA